LTRISVRLMHIMSAMDHSKATRELGWQSRPATDAIAEAARFFRDRRRRDTTAAEEAS
jgi:dihydroflavonol-4-reductase